MIRSPLGLRLDPARPIREQVRAAAQLGAKGVVVDAVGDLSPERLSDTGRREIRHLLRSVELSLVATSLPTRRAFDTIDQLDDRLQRADRAFALSFELGTTIVLARVGAIPPETEPQRREIWIGALRELGRRADHRGVRLTIEAGTDPGAALRPLLDGIASTGLAASVEPASLLRLGIDPVQSLRDLGPWVIHAYATDASASSPAGIINPRGSGFPSGVLDWEEYLGSLEEINYRGYLTVWPDPARDPGTQFTAIKNQLNRIG